MSVILFTLDTRKKKSMLGYVIASIVCLIINYIYSKFGHGVTSNYMTYMFIYPLFGGALLTMLNKKNNKSASNLFNCGIVTLVLGSFINGVLEIAGAMSNFIMIYYIFGIILIVFVYCLTFLK